MASTQVSRKDGIVRAREAAELLFDAYDTGLVRTYEPDGVEEAVAAVERFAELFDELPGAMRRVLDVGRDTGELISSDRLQGLAEIIQNADDVCASEVRLTLSSDALLVSHDGDPVRLRHILGFATPWLSTKADESSPIGRFGIGLTTLRSLSNTIEIHCSPYHVRVGSTTLESTTQPKLPAEFERPNWTTLRIPIEIGNLILDDLDRWLEKWDDSALLFLRFVSRVTLHSPSGEHRRDIRISRSNHGEIEIDKGSSIPIVRRQRAAASDGRSWMIYNADFLSPTGVSRRGKATGKSTPISVAFPLRPTSAGRIHAGLPVAPTRCPVFVSAQFDPLTNRLDLADTNWNRALVPLVAALWLEAALDLFARDPKAAWHAMPLSETDLEGTAPTLVKHIERELTEAARRHVSARLSFPVPGQEDTPLTQLAFEVEALEKILTHVEIASLAGQPATLPSGIRDTEGAWRTVLNSWRSAGADLPEPVSVDQALDLIGEESRSPEATIALTAVALIHDLGKRLMKLPCVIAQDGQYVVPPAGDSPKAIAAETTELAQQLGVVTLLHDSHLRDECSARRVLDWLETSGSVIDGSDERAVVYRLAAAGKMGGKLEASLTDEQVQALRGAFQLIDRAEHRDLGRNVGRAVALEAYTFEDNRQITVHVSPGDAYLSRRIDRGSESFAAAASNTPGPVWLSDKYESVLRSPVGRTGIGAQRFLSLLGAMTIPRPHPHSSLKRQFHSDNRLGLTIAIPGGSEARRQELRKRGATYTLQDYDNVDLQAVADDISKELEGKLRRKRSRALISALGRAWDRHLRDYIEVDAARGYYRWHIMGEVPAFWLWQLGDVAWLDDERGRPRKPSELRIRTPGTEAIYGSESSDYLHSEFHNLNRNSVLRSIGVSGDPSRSELVDRLKRLQEDFKRPRDSILKSRLKQEVAVAYKALARDLQIRTRGDLTIEQLRREFQIGKGLVLTNLGWCPPGVVLAGDPIFGDYRAFALPVSDSQPLWRALNIREPSPDDCVRVINRIALKRNGPTRSDQTILLETLRTLSSHYARGDTLPARRVRSLALWTSKGWSRERPVYTTGDPVLARGLRDQLPLWEPGGDLDQFRPLLDHLRIEEIDTRDAVIVESQAAWEEWESTELFRSAINLLEEDLARNDPRLSKNIAASWDRLREFHVRMHPALSVCIGVDSGGPDNEYVCSVDARVDSGSGIVFVRDASVLARVNGGGRALAALFHGNPRRLAHAWRAACDLAEDGLAARRIRLAHQEAEREQVEIDDAIDRRTRALQLRIEDSTNKDKTLLTRPSRPARKRGEDSAGVPRILVDPSSLRIVDRKGRIAPARQDAARKGSRGGSLVEPRRTSSVPQNRTAVPTYSDLDRESVGMEIVRMLLCSDYDDIVDLRTQRGVGADAVDKMNAFYELKVSAGAEPDKVSLTSAEFQRLLNEPNYFLIVISNIEGLDARPKVRIFVDPLNQLQLAESKSIMLTGVHGGSSLVYQFEQDDFIETSKEEIKK